MGRLVSTSYLGRAANPTVIWGQQRRDGCTDDRERGLDDNFVSRGPKEAWESRWTPSSPEKVSEVS